MNTSESWTENIKCDLFVPCDQTSTARLAFYLNSRVPLIWEVHVNIYCWVTCNFNLLLTASFFFFFNNIFKKHVGTINHNLLNICVALNVSSCSLQLITQSKLQKWTFQPYPQTELGQSSLLKTAQGCWDSEQRFDLKLK